MLDKKFSISEVQNRVSRYVGKCLPIDNFSKNASCSFRRPATRLNNEADPACENVQEESLLHQVDFFLSLIFIGPLSILIKITPGTRRASFRPLVFTFSLSTLFKIVKIRLTPRTAQVVGGRTSVYNGRYYYSNNVRRL